MSLLWQETLDYRLLLSFVVTMSSQIWNTLQYSTGRFEYSEVLLHEILKLKTNSTGEKVRRNDSINLYKGKIFGLGSEETSGWREFISHHILQKKTHFPTVSLASSTGKVIHWTIRTRVNHSIWLDTYMWQGVIVHWRASWEGDYRLEALPSPHVFTKIRIKMVKMRHQLMISAEACSRNRWTVMGKPVIVLHTWLES